MIQFYEPSHTAYYDRKAIEQDLNLVTIVRGMALREYEDEPHILEELLHPLQEKEQIRQRQQVVKACCEHGIYKGVPPAHCEGCREVRGRDGLYPGQPGKEPSE